MPLPRNPTKWPKYLWRKEGETLLGYHVRLTKLSIDLHKKAKRATSPSHRQMLLGMSANARDVVEVWNHAWTPMVHVTKRKPLR